MRYRSMLTVAAVTTGLALVGVPPAGAQEIQVHVTEAHAIEKDGDYGICGFFCPWWAQQDFYAIVKFLSDGSSFTSPVVDQRDEAQFAPAFEPTGPLPPNERFVPFEVELWDDDNEDISADDPFDPAEAAGSVLALQFDACIGTWNDTNRYYGPLPAPSSADPGTPPYSLPHARGFDPDPARMWLGVSRIGNIPAIPDDVDITGAGPVQVVSFPDRVIAGKPSVFRVDLASSWSEPRNGSIYVSVTDQITPFDDEKLNVTIPPGESTFWFFENAPFVPQKFVNNPKLTWTVQVDVDGEVTCIQDLFPDLENWGCCNLENNTLSAGDVGGPEAPTIVETRNPLTLYMAYNLDEMPDTDVPSDAEMQAQFDFSEAFRAATFPIAPPLNGFRVPARFVLSDPAECPFGTCGEPYLAAVRWSRVARMLGIDTLVLSTAPDWISRLGPLAAPWLADFSASGVTLAEFSPNAVLAEAEETTVTAHEIAHTFELSRRPCTPTEPALGLLETLIPSAGCRDEYFHQDPPRPYLAEGYDVEGTVFPGGFSWPGGTWSDVATPLPACSPVTPGTREIKCAINIMDRSTGPADLRTWIDPGSYRWLIDKLAEVADPPLVSVYGALEPSGGWDADPLAFNGELGTSYRFDGIPDLAEAKPGESSGSGFFAIALETPNGARTYRFDASFQADGAVRFDASYFALTLPWDDATTEIRLFGPSNLRDPDNSQEVLLATLGRSSSDPEIVEDLVAGRNGPAQAGPQPEPPTIGPNDTAHLTWKADDADLEPVYAVLDLLPPGSQDPGDYNGRIPLAVDNQDSTFLLPHGTVDWREGTWGGRVTVSDGINTVSQENAQLFTVCNYTNQAAEVCDGLDNDCNGTVDDVVAPAGYPKVGMEKSLVTWTPLAEAENYDAVHGDLGALRSTGGDFAAATTGCLGDAIQGNSVPFPDVPAPGEGFWVLVRPVNCAGPGTYDGPGAGQVQSRDGGIAQSGAACP